MDTYIQYHETIAAVTARIFLGLLFFFQGYDAVFRIKVSNIIYTYNSAFRAQGIPSAFTTAGAWFTSLAELIGGSLLILGLFKYMALYLLAFDLIIAATAFGINKPMWDMSFVFPRLALLIFLLCIPQQWDILSIDHLLINH